MKKLIYTFLLLIKIIFLYAQDEILLEDNTYQPLGLKPVYNINEFLGINFKKTSPLQYNSPRIYECRFCKYRDTFAGIPIYKFRNCKRPEFANDEEVCIRKMYLVIPDNKKALLFLNAKGYHSLDYKGTTMSKLENAFKEKQATYLNFDPFNEEMFFSTDIIENEENKIIVDFENNVSDWSFSLELKRKVASNSLNELNNKWKDTLEVEKFMLKLNYGTLVGADKATINPNTIFDSNIKFVFSDVTDQFIWSNNTRFYAGDNLIPKPKITQFSILKELTQNELLLINIPSQIKECHTIQEFNQIIASKIKPAPYTLLSAKEIKGLQFNIQDTTNLEIRFKNLSQNLTEYYIQNNLEVQNDAIIEKLLNKINTKNRNTLGSSLEELQSQIQNRIPEKNLLWANSIGSNYSNYLKGIYQSVHNCKDIVKINTLELITTELENRRINYFEKVFQPDRERRLYSPALVKLKKIKNTILESTKLDSQLYKALSDFIIVIENSPMPLQLVNSANSLYIGSWQGLQSQKAILDSIYTIKKINQIEIEKVDSTSSTEGSKSKSKSDPINDIINNTSLIFSGIEQKVKNDDPIVLREVYGNYKNQLLNSWEEVTELHLNEGQRKAFLETNFSMKKLLTDKNLFLLNDKSYTSEYNFTINKLKIKDQYYERLLCLEKPFIRVETYLDSVFSKDPLAFKAISQSVDTFNSTIFKNVNTIYEKNKVLKNAKERWYRKPYATEQLGVYVQYGFNFITLNKVYPSGSIKIEFKIKDRTTKSIKNPKLIRTYIPFEIGGKTNITKPSGQKITSKQEFIALGMGLRTRNLKLLSSPEDYKTFNKAVFSIDGGIQYTLNRKIENTNSVKENFFGFFLTTKIGFWDNSAGIYARYNYFLSKTKPSLEFLTTRKGHIELGLFLRIKQ